MALITIIAVNQTAGALALTQLMAPNGVIAASGQAQLTDWNYVEEILRDSELQAHITADDVLLTVNSIALTKEQSLAFLDAPTTPVKVSLGLSSSAPTANDSAATGYSVGSVWITTAGVPYLCVDATAAAAVWKQTDAVTPPYDDIATSDTETTTGATTAVVLGGMTITPPAGTYLVWFNADVSASKNGTEGALQIAVDDVEVAHSERTHLFSASAASTSVSTQARVTVTGAQAIQGRWYIVTGVNPTLTATDRSLMIVAVEAP